MTVENISWSISTKECCRPRRGLNPRPPGLQSDDASNWATEAGETADDGDNENSQSQTEPMSLESSDKPKKQKLIFTDHLFYRLAKAADKKKQQTKKSMLLVYKYLYDYHSRSLVKAKDKKSLLLVYKYLYDYHSPVKATKKSLLYITV